MCSLNLVIHSITIKVEMGYCFQDSIHGRGEKELHMSLLDLFITGSSIIWAENTIWDVNVEVSQEEDIKDHRESW